MQTYESNVRKAREMYLNNDEFHDYIEREARTGKYSIDELLMMAHVHEYMNWLIKKY